MKYEFLRSRVIYSQLNSTKILFIAKLSLSHNPTQFGAELVIFPINPATNHQPWFKNWMCKLLLWGGWGVFTAGLGVYAAGLGIACVTLHCVRYYIGVLSLHSFFCFFWFFWGGFPPFFAFWDTLWYFYNLVRVSNISIHMEFTQPNSCHTNTKDKLFFVAFFGWNVKIKKMPISRLFWLKMKK